MDEQQPAGNQASKPAGIQFLDFLFTLAIGFGVSLGTPGSKTSLLSEDWIANGRLPSGTEILGLLTSLLAFFTLTLSWFGYHRAMQDVPLRFESSLSMFRFVIDVFLIILYGMMFIEYRYLNVVLFLLLLVYLLYVVWEVLAFLEFRNKTYPDQGIRVNLVTFVLLLIMSVFWWTRALSDVWAIIIAIGITIVYRLVRYGNLKFLH